MAGALGKKIPQALPVGRGEYRRDLYVLSLAAAASQASEVNQHVGKVQRRDQTADAADFSPCGQLSAVDPGPGGRDP